MKQLFFGLVLCATTTSKAQVAVNLPTGQSIDPLATFQVCGSTRIDSLPIASTPTYVLVLDQYDSILHKLSIASLASFIFQSTPSPIPIIRTYTTNSIWTKPPGLKYIIVEVVGGGGGGGGCYNYGGGAGAAGGYAKKIISAQTLSATEVVTVGAGGTGGPPQSPGGTGGTTSFGLHCSATGGEGGKAQTTTVNTTDGSVGGIGINGDINIDGSGSGGAVTSGQTLYTGASSHFGGGARTTRSEVSSNGFNSQNYGSGGSGGNGNTANGGPNKSGGNGSSGILIITEHY
jgi:hypothetical protein